MKKLDTQTITN